MCLDLDFCRSFDKVDPSNEFDRDFRMNLIRYTQHDLDNLQTVSHARTTWPQYPSKFLNTLYNSLKYL